MKEDKELIKSLNTLRESVDTSNSWSRAFLLGIVRGIGAVIGASLLAGLLLGWAAATFDSLGELPLVGGYLAEISEAVDQPE